MAGRVYNNTVGESIYKQIQDFDKVSKMVFLKNLPSETRKLYEKFLVAQRQRRYKESSDNKVKANEAAKLGMQKLRETKPKEVIKEQRKPWDIKYETKRRMTRDEAASVIQREVRKNRAEKLMITRAQAKKKEANTIASSILDDILNVVPNMKIVNGELKKKRGRRVGQTAKK
jgi:alpha-galactosidase/6-phospho-beta-glucosidase family protein